MNSDPTETNQSSDNDYIDSMITDNDTLTRLNSRPNYDPAVNLFSAATPTNDLNDAKMVHWHKRNARLGPFERKRRINASLSQASGIDVLYGDLPAQMRFFGEDYTTIFTSRPGM